MSAVLTPASELRRLSIADARKLSVGGRIRWARAKRGLSHDDLASQIGSSRSYLIRVEKGQHMPSPEFRERVARATDQDAAFFGDDDEEELRLVFDSEPIGKLVEALVIRLQAEIAEHRLAGEAA